MNEPQVAEPITQHERQLRGDLLRLRSEASTTPLAQWLEKAQGLIERECVKREERLKERYFTGRRAE